MQLALTEAESASSQGHVPVGAVLVFQEKCLFKGHNLSGHSDFPLKHAEMNVLEMAMGHLSQEEWRMTTLYVTLEPCPMCMGAILHTHLGRLVFGAANLKWGACGSVADLSHLYPSQNLEIVAGILERQSQNLLSSFFKACR